MAFAAAASSSKLQLQLCNYTASTSFHSLRSPSSQNRGHVMPALASEPGHSASSSSSADDQSIPKMEPFNRSRVSRLIREPSLLEKAEQALSDRCSVLEGDEAFKCWEAFFDFEDLKQEYKQQCDIAPAGERQTACQPLERLENLVRQSGGSTSLINNVRMVAKANEMRKMGQAGTSGTIPATLGAVVSDEGNKHIHFPEPGALPPSEEELELERSAKMPESPFTRVLRSLGNHVDV